MQAATTTGAATKLMNLLDDGFGEGQELAVYELSPPRDGHRYVIVSSLFYNAGSETYRETLILPSDSDGRIIDPFDRLSIHDGLDHVAALLAIGYEIAAEG